jgi:preprotein translocase subunit SecE
MTFWTVIETVAGFLLAIWVVGNLLGGGDGRR